MRSTLRAPAALASFLLLLSACSDQPTAVLQPSVASLVKGRPQPAIPLVVTVEVTPNMASDGITEPGYAAGDYVDGVQGMIAEFDDPGNLQFTPVNASTTPPLRTLAISYGTQLTFPTGTYAPNTSGQHNFKIKTGNAGTPRIQDLGVGGAPVTECYATTIATASGGAGTPTVHHQAVFNSAVAGPGPTFARITRISATEWTMISDGGCTGTPNVAAVSSRDLTRKNQPLVFRGNYILQFSLRFRVRA